MEASLNTNPNPPSSPSCRDEIKSVLLETTEIIGALALSAIILVGTAVGLCFAAYNLPLVFAVGLVLGAITGAILCPILTSGFNADFFEQKYGKTHATSLAILSCSGFIAGGAVLGGLAGIPALPILKNVLWILTAPGRYMHNSLGLPMIQVPFPTLR